MDFTPKSDILHDNVVHDTLFSVQYMTQHTYDPFAKVPFWKILEKIA